MSIVLLLGQRWLTARVARRWRPAGFATSKQSKTVAKIRCERHWPRRRRTVLEFSPHGKVKWKILLTIRCGWGASTRGIAIPREVAPKRERSPLTDSMILQMAEALRPKRSSPFRKSGKSLSVPLELLSRATGPRICSHTPADKSGVGGQRAGRRTSSRPMGGYYLWAWAPSGPVHRSRSPPL